MFAIFIVHDPHMLSHDFTITITWQKLSLSLHICISSIHIYIYIERERKHNIHRYYMLHIYTQYIYIYIQYIYIYIYDSVRLILRAFSPVTSGWWKVHRTPPYPRAPHLFLSPIAYCLLIAYALWLIAYWLPTDIPPPRPPMCGGRRWGWAGGNVGPSVGSGTPQSAQRIMPWGQC